MPENTNLETIKKLDQLLFEFDKNIQEIKAFELKLKSTQNMGNELSNYLQSEDWMLDYEDFGHLNFHILGEDGLYNALEDFENLKKEILQFIANNLK